MNFFSSIFHFLHHKPFKQIHFGMLWLYYQNLGGKLMNRKYTICLALYALFFLFGFNLFQSDTSVLADSIILADYDMDDLYEHEYRGEYYPSKGYEMLYEMLEEFLEASGSFLQYFFILAFALVIPVQLLKHNILGEERKPMVQKLRKWLWKIHIPVAVIGIIGVLLHGVLAFFYKNPFNIYGIRFEFVFSDHFSGLIAAILLLGVIISGILRYKKGKGIWLHLILALLFIISYLIHG